MITGKNKLVWILFISLLDLAPLKALNRPTSFNFKGKKYDYSTATPSFILLNKNDTVYRYDTLRLFISAGKKKRHLIYVNKNNIVVITGQTITCIEDVGYTKKKPQLISPAVGMWRYYDNKGKLLLKRREKGKSRCAKGAKNKTFNSNF